MPCILIENKKDLLSEEELNNESYLYEFSLLNNFDGYFRCSAKTGENVEESMNFLIQKIIDRFHSINPKDINLYGMRNSLSLTPEEYNKRKEREKIKESQCC